MAAFCGCCGAEITSKKNESCPACGAPTHGMLLTDPFQPMELERETSQNKEPRPRRCEVHQIGKNTGC
jgi:hypothetical protein